MTSRKSWNAACLQAKLAGYFEGTARQDFKISITIVE
jgi:hypothetical protein